MMDPQDGSETEYMTSLLQDIRHTTNQPNKTLIHILAQRKVANPPTSMFGMKKPLHKQGEHVKHHTNHNLSSGSNICPTHIINMQK